MFCLVRQHRDEWHLGFADLLQGWGSGPLALAVIFLKKINTVASRADVFSFYSRSTSSESREDESANCVDTGQLSRRWRALPRGVRTRV